MVQEQLTDDVIEVVREVLRQELQAFGLTHVDVVIAPDHTGDPSIKIDAIYTDTERPIDVTRLVSLTGKLRDRLWAMGEHRFPYVRHHFAENRKVVGFK